MNLWSETGVLRIGSKSTGGELATPQLDCVADGDITLTFKAKKYASSDAGVVLSVQSEFSDTELSDNDSFEISNEWQEYSFTFSRDGNRFSLLFSTEESTGAMRVCIDDIQIIQESCEREKSIGYYVSDIAEYSFSGLAKGKYRFRVKALDEGIDSDFSEKREVVIDENTAIVPVAADDNEYVEVYSLSGLSVYKGEKSGISALDKGVYILRTPSGVRKISVK